MRTPVVVGDPCTRGRGGEYFDHSWTCLIRLRTFVVPGKREVDSGRKFNGRTAGIRMHAHSWLRRTYTWKRRARSAIRGERWWVRGERYKRWKKGPRKHYERNIALTRATSRLSLTPCNAVSQHAPIHKRTHVCTQHAYDNRHVIWYFNRVCALLPSRDSIRSSSQSFFLTS